MFFPLSDINPRFSRPLITIALIIVTVIAFLFSLQDFEVFIESYGFIPAAASISTAFTSIFLHGGFDHLFGNMWFLWLFSDNVEYVFGGVHHLLFYLLSGMIATLTHYLTNFGSTIPTIGASGAVSGVLGAYLVFFPRVRVRALAGYGIVINISASTLLILWFVMQFLFGSLSFLGGVGSGIAFAAHVGGFVFGYLYARLFKRFFPQRIPTISETYERIRFPTDKIRREPERWITND